MKVRFINWRSVYYNVFKLINRKTILFISVLILSITVIIPSVKSIKNTVYLEGGERTPAYTFDLIKGDLIFWEFRTYNDSFSCGLLIVERSTYISWRYTADKGIYEVLESITYRFRFENEENTGGGYLEFELKIIKRINGYNILFIFIAISFVSIISILKVKGLKIA